MFTIDQIKAAHSKVKSGADFPRYIQDIIELGVTGFETFVSDSHTVYHGSDGYETSSLGMYPPLDIQPATNGAQFESDLKAHQRGETDYLTFCKDCAKSGVEKWRVDMGEMTCTYYDSAGDKVLVEEIPVS